LILTKYPDIKGLTEINTGGIQPKNAPPHRGCFRYCPENRDRQQSEKHHRLNSIGSLQSESTTTRKAGGLDFTALGGKRQGREVPQSLRVEPGAKHPVWKTQTTI